MSFRQSKTNRKETEAQLWGLQQPEVLKGTLTQLKNYQLLLVQDPSVTTSKYISVVMPNTIPGNLLHRLCSTPIVINELNGTYDSDKLFPG